MSKTTKVVTEVELKAIPLPKKTETYTVISHGFIIDEVKAELVKAGFEVMSEEYRANNNLEVARGSYIIRRSEDPNFMMSFNWTNSYDKSTKFQCAVGGYVWENNSFVIDKEDNAFIRKHTGDADTLVKDTIADKIANAETHYQTVLAAKRAMQEITVNRQQVAKMLGELYFSYDMISIEQLSGIKKEYNKPSYVYSTNSDSLWTVYCHMLTIIKSSHPKLWLHQQGFIHNYIKMNYLMATDKAPEVGLPIRTAVLEASPTEKVDPAQINMLDQIAEITAEDSKIYEAIPTLKDLDLYLAQFEDNDYELISRNELPLIDVGDITYYNKEQYTVNEIFVDDKGELGLVLLKTKIHNRLVGLDDMVTFEVDKYKESTAEEKPLDPMLDENFGFTEEEVAEVEEAKQLWAPDEDEDDEPVNDSPEITGIPNGDTMSDTDDDLIVTDPAVISVLKSEITNIFGHEVDIDVYVDGENYSIVTTDGQEVTVPIDYVKSLV